MGEAGLRGRMPLKRHFSCAQIHSFKSGSGAHGSAGCLDCPLGWTEGKQVSTLRNVSWVHGVDASCWLPFGPVSWTSLWHLFIDRRGPWCAEREVDLPWGIQLPCEISGSRFDCLVQVSCLLLGKGQSCPFIFRCFRNWSCMCPSVCKISPTVNTTQNMFPYKNNTEREFRKWSQVERKITPPLKC
jgi:hypothetical protein